MNELMNEWYHEVIKLCRLPKIQKSMIVESAINTQNSEIIEIFEWILKLRPIVGGAKCPTRELTQLIDKKAKPFLKHITSLLCDNIDNSDASCR